MKKFIIILSVIGSTITIMLTASLIYPTRNELHARVEGIKDTLCRLEKHVLRNEKKLDRILLKLTRRYK